MVPRSEMPPSTDEARIKLVTAIGVACATLAAGIVIGMLIATDNDRCAQAARQSTHVIAGYDMLLGRLVDFLEAPPGSYDEDAAASDVTDLIGDIELDMTDWQRERDACLLLPGDDQ